MTTIFVDPISRTVYRAMNPLGETELEKARKNREGLQQYDREYPVVEIKVRPMFRKYKGSYKRK